jgi:hypothetical protein
MPDTLKCKICQEAKSGVTRVAPTTLLFFDAATSDIGGTMDQGGVDTSGQETSEENDGSN